MMASTNAKPCFGCSFTGHLKIQEHSSSASAIIQLIFSFDLRKKSASIICLLLLTHEDKCSIALCCC